MQVLLNKNFASSKLILFLTLLFALFNSCANPGQKQKSTTPVATPKKIPAKKNIKKEISLPPKPQLLVKDVINRKNVRSFFTQYGKENPETKLLLKTRLGTIHITLYKQTPLHRASFIYLIKNGYYNKTCFHRIATDFMIQGGWSDKAIVDAYRTQLNNYRLPPEFRKNLIHKRGALSATRRWVENPEKRSNPFEFFIIQTKIDCSHLDGEHTVFGEITKGLDIVDKIIDVKLDGNSEWPEVDVNIEFVILN